MPVSTRHSWFCLRPQRLFERFLINVAQLRNSCRHNHLPVNFDFNLFRNSLSDYIRGEAVLYCYLFDSRKVTCVAREHYPAGILAEEHKFGRQLRIEASSTSDTANPPSEQSCADSTKPD